jgi:hypothetical protein
MLVLPDRSVIPDGEGGPAASQQSPREGVRGQIQFALKALSAKTGLFNFLRPWRTSSSIWTPIDGSKSTVQRVLARCLFFF